MLEAAGDLVASRQLSKQKPRLYSDYRKMLAEKDLDLVIIGTPDHWHALNAIEAMKAGADLYCQKPTSVDVKESLAMLDTARQLGRVVQIGTQRRSTPHLIRARDEIVKAGKLGKVGLVEICCYYHMRHKGKGEPKPVPEHLDYEMWTGPAPLRPYTGTQHPRSWRAFMEYGNGIVGDMCVHMLDTARWLLDLGWPKSISSTGGILVDRESAANITDTQNAVFDYGDLQVVWQHRSYGDAPDPKYPWAVIIYGDKGTLKASVNSFDFIPRDKGSQTVHQDVVMELDKFPEDQTEKDLEKHVAPAIRGHMQDLIRNIRTRGRPVADIEQGVISSASCILANVSMDLGRTLRFDPATRSIPGDAEAEKRLARPYRQPWVHPAAV
jgi:predicted dehydrogenase